VASAGAREAFGLSLSIAYSRNRPAHERLVHFLATTLDQNDQQNDSNNAGDDPDD
jgi:hypothetical protein